MNRGPQQDPGEDPPPSGPSHENPTEPADLKDQFEQQQVLIAQLKEMLRKTDQSNVSQEKVDRYASTLSRMSVRAKKSKLKRESVGEVEPKSNIETPVNEKISLLRKQLEENKAKLAERGKSRKDIEEMVTQLKAQFDDSLQLMHDTSSSFFQHEVKTEYNKDSSSEELYNVLLSKETHINDLQSKIQKLETTVLDLQENLKEKDCVIDARTKAITLMTESLSKKSKNTQDTLDETKEQMRKMQQDFIQLENEMKARQIKLLDDLRSKNLEIAELQETNENIKKQLRFKESDENSELDVEKIEMRNEIDTLMLEIESLRSENVNLYETNEEMMNVAESLRSEIEKFKLTISLKEKEIEESKSEIEKLEESVKNLKEVTSVEDNDGEKSKINYEKLKKDLEEANKQITKMRSEHKKKLKTLNKKIDSFKKIGDLNAHIVKLSEENDSFKEKIAELEEEKGSYQLNMMESISKDSPIGENVEELEMKVCDLSKTVENQKEELARLKTENESLKEQVENSNEKLEKLSLLQSEKVTSEITSIQLEELSETLKKEKEDIISEKETLQKEIETLNREKTEIHTKLDQYVQENMELIDKLEKMSAEKVSSAESIEIVENLTHQEKLELEEYQKNLDPCSGKLKLSEEHLERTSSNSSGNGHQSSEETSELVQKIELFTVERREVMEKMESLKKENAELNLKLKQVENNSEILTETYEQLQSEKEELESKISELEKENGKLNEKIENMKKDTSMEVTENLKKKLYELEGEYLNLVEENEKIRGELKLASEEIHEKDQLEEELKKTKRKVSEMEGKLVENLETISTYQSIMEENKEEFIKSAENINKLREILEIKEGEISSYKSEIEVLNSKVNDFNVAISNLEEHKKKNEEKTDKIEVLEEELRGLKSTLEENLKQMEDYENEIEENSILIKNLNQQLIELKNKNLEMQNLLENGKIEELNEEIKRLNEQIKNKDEIFHKVSGEMKEKFEELQRKTDSNAESLEDIREPLQKKIEELTSKNNALVEKMKKIAANLKKKMQTCQDLEKQLQTSEEELKQKDSDLKKVEEEVDVLKKQIEEYQKKKVEEEKQQMGVEIKSEVSLQDELTGSLMVRESFSSSMNDSKIQELELLVETQNNEISNYKERVSSLEEALAKIDEQRETLEQKTTELGVQLLEKSQSFEEISKTEDVLEEKFKNLKKYSEEVERKLGEVSSENQMIQEENHKLKETKKKLKQKLNVAQEKVNELIQIQQNIGILEQELENSKNQVNNLEQELRKLESEKIQLEETSKNEMEKLDNDWQVQFEEMSKEKSELTVFCEKMNEKISELEEIERNLNEKIEDLELKLEKSLEMQKSSENELMFLKEENERICVELTAKNEEIVKMKEVVLRFESENGELKSSLDKSSRELEIVHDSLDKTNNQMLELERKARKTEEKPQTSGNFFTLTEEDPFSFVDQMSNVKNREGEEWKKKEEEIRKMTEEIVRLESENKHLRASVDELFEELNSVKDLFRQTNEELVKIKTRNEELEGVSYKENLEEGGNLFVWSDHQDDHVKEESSIQVKKEDLLEQPIPQKEIVDSKSSRDELLQKIKTLEFMFKNVENERDDVLEQCSHLSNELMRFVYEKAQQNSEHKAVAAVFHSTSIPNKVEQEIKTLVSVESQVLPSDFPENSGLEEVELEYTKCKDIIDQGVVPSEEESFHKKEAYLCHPDQSVEKEILPFDYFKETVGSRKELQDFEFVPTSEYNMEHEHPVEEAEVQKKEAYKCYPDEISKNVESEVLPSDYFKETKETRKELKDLEFVSTKDYVEHKEPVVEKKEAYLCYMEPANVNTFGEDDDGWGWNPEEAKLEEQHNKEFESNPLRIKIVELEEKIRILEEEREKKNGEYQELQLKSGKLVKKLKETKTKLETLEQGKKQKDDDFFSLENAIQEELKTQIVTLEKKINEVENELTKEKNEKQSLQKKIEMLSSTNERMKELKEKQDVEILMWQRKADEFKCKFEEFEWGVEKSPEKKKIEEPRKANEGDVNLLNVKIAELNETIKELVLDNEELQALLEEQRILRLNAEKSKSVEPILENMKSEAEFLEVLKQKQELESEMSNVNCQKKRLQDELNTIIKNNDEQFEEYKKLQEFNNQLQKAIEERNLLVENLSINIENIQQEKLNYELQIQQLTQKIQSLEELQQVNSSQESELQFSNQIALLQKELQEKITIIEGLTQEKERFSRLSNEKEVEIRDLELSIQEKTDSLKIEIEQQKSNSEKLIIENESLLCQKNELEGKIEKLVQQIHDRETECQCRIDKLNQDWQVLVDQRGTDVAESWKLHVESRESEFGEIEGNLRREINELEEKCNTLVNENNELRKNVDLEIRNEVDRVSALQQQINERQQYINEITQAMYDKQSQMEALELRISGMQSQVADLEREMENKNVRINELQIIVEATQKQFDEKRLIVEAIVKKLEEKSSSPILFELENIMEELTNQIKEKISNEDLTRITSELNEKNFIVTNLQNVLTSKIEQIKELDENVETYKRRIGELEELLRVNSGIAEELGKKLSEKEKIEGGVEEELRCKLGELEVSNKKIEEFSLSVSKKDDQIAELVKFIADKDQTISDLNDKLQLKENENEAVQNLQFTLQEYQLHCDGLKSELDQKSSLIDAMNEELQKQHNIHLERESEIETLKMHVEELQKTFEIEKNELEKNKNGELEILRQEITALTNQIRDIQIINDELRLEKENFEGSIRYLQEELQEQAKYVEELSGQVENYKKINEELTRKLTEQEELQKKYEEQDVLLKEEDKQMVELKEIIEEQVLKIEELKKKLFEKSNDYDSLIAEMDVRKDDIENLSAAERSKRAPMGRGQPFVPTTDEDFNQWVPSSELDIALYMLHQRDVRCEELTVELTQLLEERDTLQLKLSNALREKEQFRKMAGDVEKPHDGNVSAISMEGSPSKGAISKGRVAEIVMRSSGTEMATEAEEITTSESLPADSQLEQKLSELKKIGYKRDKTLLDEQQQRRLQQLSIMQQHMDEASKLPPEAAARLVDASYTLSRDVQSPSKVLLNWLWGKSTPKVNEL